MAYFQKKPLKDGNFSYRFYQTIKNPLTGKTQKETDTWRPQKGLTKKEEEKAMQTALAEFEKACQKIEDGFLAGTNINPTFAEYSAEWLKQLETLDYSPTYHDEAADTVSHLNEYLGHMKVKAISPRHIQNCIDSLCTLDIGKPHARLKCTREDIQLHLKTHKIMVASLKKHAYEALLRGNNVRVESAEEIATAIGVPFDMFFEKIETHRTYARESILRHKRVLCTILAKAKRELIVEENYATHEFVVIKKADNEAEILALVEDEAVKLAETLSGEEDKRLQISVALALFLGLRRSEVAGLEWKDIDFANTKIKIQRACVCTKKGIVTKCTKSKKSKREFSFPEFLVEPLKAYKSWWDKRKSILADLWGDTDRLFMNDRGKPIHPNTLLSWLRKMLEKAGLTKVTLHSLRHTNLTVQLTNGTDGQTVCDRAGHSDPTVTYGWYSHSSEELDKKASQTLDKIFRGAFEKDKPKTTTPAIFKLCGNFE